MGEHAENIAAGIKFSADSTLLRIVIQCYKRTQNNHLAFNLNVNSGWKHGNCFECSRSDREKQR